MTERPATYRGRLRLTAPSGLVAVVAALAIPAAAFAAYSEAYGGGPLCGSNCYVQSSGSHSFILNEGASKSSTPTLACQLFNSKGANEVTHGKGYCVVYYFGGAYVSGRVYNQSGATFSVGGFAET